MPNLTGATGEVTINGAVYVMTPLCDRDIEELNVWLRSKIISAARASLPPGSPQVLEDKTMAQAMRIATTIDWMQNPEMLESPENILRLIWQLMRKRHPDLDSEFFTRQLLEDPDSLVRCRDLFRLLHPMLSGDEELPSENPPKRPGTTGQKSTQQSSTKAKRKQKKQARNRARK